jgi:hypothetical protein
LIVGFKVEISINRACIKHAKLVAFKPQFSPPKKKSGDEIKSWDEKSKRGTSSCFSRLNWSSHCTRVSPAVLDLPYIFF